MNAVWPELGLPGFRIIPYLTERVEYNSNILLQPRNELDDLVSRTIPGVVVELPLGRSIRGHREGLSDAQVRGRKVVARRQVVAGTLHLRDACL